jgi:transposase, IS5 family
MTSGRKSGMEKARFVKTGKDSFFGEYLYEKTVPEGHFLRKLKQEIDWDRFTHKLIKLYKGEGLVGRPPFDPAMLLKIELVAYLYNLSERQVEVYINENLPAKYFVGLAVDESAPDHSTLTVFRDRLLKRGKMKIFKEMLEEIVRIALEKGIQFGSIQLIDSVHSVANVNTAKDRQRDKNDKGPHDPDAQWGAKHKQTIKKADGSEETRTQYFYGYKTHTSMNAETGIITSVEVTSGEAFDGHHFCSLVDHDIEQDIQVETYAADKAYDDTENHFYLQENNLHSAIRLKNSRTNKKDPNKQPWQELKKTAQYQLGSKERYKIERKFGEAKQTHGFGKCRYIGKPKYLFQATFVAMVLNLKRIIKMTAGVGFKTQAFAD